MCEINLKELFKFNNTSRTYHIWVINTPLKLNLYQWDKWQLILPLANTLIELTKEPAFIRTFQSYIHENRWLGFGRMKWNEANNKKWCTKYREGVLFEKQPEFFNTEIWAPDWNKVCDTGMPPNIFINLHGYTEFNGIGENLVIALPKSLYKKHQSIVDNVLSEITKQIPQSKIFQTKRQWWGSTFLSRNNVEDMTIHEISKIITDNQKQ